MLEGEFEDIHPRSSLLTWDSQPPFGDVDDRVRYIAEQLDLMTIIWQFDTDDWEGSPQEVEANYANFIQKAASEAFNSVSL